MNTNDYVYSLFDIQQTATEDVTSWDTGVDLDVLRWVWARTVHIPSNFSLHPTLKRGHVDARLNKLFAGTNLDWSTAESLAIASLLYQGSFIEISFLKLKKYILKFDIFFDRIPLSN